MKGVLKKISEKMKAVWAQFEPHSFTLFGIHVVELVQTAAVHAEQWGQLHTAMVVAMSAKVLKLLQEKQ